MTFPTSGTTRIGIDTAGDMSGAAYNTDGSAKVEWATMLSNAYDVASGTFKVSVAGAKGCQLGPFPIVQTGLTATKDVITAIPLGFVGTIVGVYGLYTVAAGSSSGAGTLDFVLSTAGQVESVGAVNVTLTLSHTATLNTIVSQSALPSINNTFIASDTLKIHYTQGTTFASDTGVIWVYIVTN